MQKQRMGGEAMLNDANLAREELDELNELFGQLKQIECLAEKSKREKTISEIVGVLIFVLTGSVMLYLGSGILGYLIWIALYGFLLYYIFGVRKSEGPEYSECVQAAKFIVSDCVKIIEHRQIAEIIYSDPEFYIEKYNKLVAYYPHMASKTLKSLIHKKPKS